MSERKSSFKNSSGIELKEFYTENALAGESLSLGRPGEYPFTRGVQKNMYRGRLWTMRQYAGFGSAKESNERFRRLLKEGSTGLSVAFDLPTQMGFDSDHVMASGEVGRVGVAISSMEDMEILFKNIPLDGVSTSMTINSTAAILLAMYLVLAKKKKVPWRALKGTVQNDLLKEYVARGTYIYPPGPSLRIITDIFDFCSREVPEWNSISISGYHIREAGATAAQELAFTLANGICYVESALKRGLDVNQFGARLSFFFNVHNQFFEEIAKFRAARRMWAKIMKERFKTQDPKAQKLRFHTQTAGVSLTAQQPENNIARVTHQALAAVLGGTQSLHTNSMDEALGLPTERAAQIALRTQQILAFETGVTDVVDPLAGSYYVERLTNEIERKAWEYIQTIEARGGVISCIESGWIQREIQNSAYQYQKAIESGDEIIVGVTQFKSGHPGDVETLRVSSKVARDQVARLKNYKKKRNLKRVFGALGDLESAARGEMNLVPPIISCVESKATLGEISDTLRKVFGSHRSGGQ